MRTVVDVDVGGADVVMGAGQAGAVVVGSGAVDVVVLGAGQAGAFEVDDGVGDVSLSSLRRLKNLHSVAH